MSRLLGLVRGLGTAEDGATTAEYVLMAALVAVACLAAVSAFGGAVAGLFRVALGGLG